MRRSLIRRGWRLLFTVSMELGATRLIRSHQ
ncbi:hypothetical protein LINPERPRIM_LOCUS2228 [Linum perenne]